MKVKDNNLHALLSLNGTDFVIPVYQRNYAWQQEHCDQLFADILAINSTEKQHFLGTITYIVHSGNNSIEFTIIDGQQRITTIMLLLKAMQDNARIKKNEIMQKKIDSYLFGFNDKSKVRLKPIKKDREAFDCVMSGRLQDFRGKSNVVDNFRFFQRKLNTLTEEKIEQMLKTFPRLQIAEVVLDKSLGDDPQVVFERINATGLHLKGLDLIRNFLMMELKPDEQERIFDDYWAKIEEIFSDEKDSEKVISKFINIYLRIYYGKNLKDDEKDIYDKFKKLRKNNFYDESEQILKDMLKFARIYKIIIDKSEPWYYENIGLEQKQELRKKIKYIAYMSFSPAYPLVMRLFDDFENERLDFENFNGILNLLISYFVRGTICSVRTASLQNFYNVYKELDSVSADSLARYLGEKSGVNIFANNQRVLRHFQEQTLYKSKIVPLILYEIERLDNHETPTLESLNVEHFYPQTPTPKWRELVGDEWTDLEQNYKDTLGNLTLSDSKLNIKMGNKSFEEKVRLYEDKGSLHLNRYFSKCDKWGIDEIKERAQWLFERFIKIDIFKDIKDEFRRTPELITLNSENNKWVYLKPRSVKFPDGSERSVSSIRGVIRAIIEYLQENYPSELEVALRQGFSFIYFGEVEKRDGFVVEDFGEFIFGCSAKGESLRAAAEKLVEACDLEPSEFEIITI